MKLNSSPLLIDFLRHIQQELLYIIRQTAGKESRQVLDDPTRQRALTYSLLVIGKACKNVAVDFQHEYAAFDWRGFANLHDHLVYKYWKVDQDVFWKAISVDVPINKEWIDVIIEQESNKL